MKVEGNYTFNAPIDFVWQTILDPEVLAVTLPGVQELDKTGDNEYKAVMKIRIGPVQGVFNGTVKLSELDAPNGCHLKVDGRGAPGFVNGEGHIRLEAEGETTILHYQGDAQVGGRLASVGQRLMESSTQALIGQSLESLNKQINARLAGDEEGASVEPIEPPSQLEFAAGVTKRMVEDMLPPDKQQLLLKYGLAALGVLFILQLVGNWWANKLAGRIADVLEERERRSRS